jgi:hypothetical protein
MRSLPIALFLLAVPPAAFANPLLSLSWDDCAVLATDKSWTGPGTYALVISGTGFDGSYTAVDVGISFFPNYVWPAWNFSKYDYWGSSPKCQDPERLTVSGAGGTCPSYPAQSRLGYMFEGGLGYAAPQLIYVHVALDPAFVAAPAVRYVVTRLEFDHTNSIAGAIPVPGSCELADAPLCIHLHGGSIFRGGDQRALTVFEHKLVTWQSAAITPECLGATPAQARTWGGIKATCR